MSVDHPKCAAVEARVVRQGTPLPYLVERAPAGRGELEELRAVALAAEYLLGVLDAMQQPPSTSPSVLAGAANRLRHALEILDE